MNTGGVMIPVGTAGPIVQRLYKAVTTIVAEPDTREPGSWLTHLAS